MRATNKQPNSRHCFICGLQNEAGVQAVFYETQGEDGSPVVEAR
jgi:hypothetical protein